MRTLLAYHLGKADIDPPEKKNFDSNSSLQRIFGVPAEVAPKEEAIGPTRLIVRDAHPDQETVMMWKNLDSELMYTEYKPENTINKITSAANPRFLERVVKGSCFNFEMIFGVYKLDNCEKQDIDFFKDLLLSMKLLEHNTLGGSGSRGYGKISFKLEEPYVLTRADYLKPDERFKNSLKDIDVTFDKDKYLRLSDFTDEKLAGNMNKFKNCKMKIVYLYPKTSFSRIYDADFLFGITLTVMRYLKGEEFTRSVVESFEAGSPPFFSLIALYSTR
jgi:CRISPR-associated protein Csm3